MTSILKHDPTADYFNDIYFKLHGLLSYSRSHANGNSKHIDHTLAKLYNAYQEASFADKFAELNDCGANAIYADSGGLQIVTRGITIDENVRKDIYKNQLYSNYAMCFDVIALKNINTTYVRNERMLTDNKIFKHDEHIEAGHLTGKNVKEQIEYFKSFVPGKFHYPDVIIIVQGNCVETMLDYYNALASELSDEDYEGIAGIAIADTCMGNGELESIHMIAAAHEIAKICHPKLKNHLHFLGVGAINRMRPIIYLTKTGYLKEYKKISYDSSSISITCLMGNVNRNGKLEKLGPYKTRESEQHFRNVYRFFKDVFSDLGDEDTFIEYVFGDGEKGCWTYAQIRERVKEKPNKVLGLAAHPAHVYYQINNFMLNIDKLFDDNYNHGNPINQLLAVKDSDDMKYWETNFSKYMNSNRIQSGNFSNLEGFFE